MISIILCTHNPRHDYINRVLKALDQQTLPKNEWELLFVDNASERILSGSYDLSWHSDSCYIRENKLGLTPARLSGIKKAKGEVIVFVDDDLILADDYLEQVGYIMKTRHDIGAFGGKISGVFEGPVPEWVKSYFQFLAINEWGDEPKWTCDKKAKKTIPCGAGLVIRTHLAESYANNCQNTIRESLGRKGRKLSGHEDTDMIYHSIDKGYAVGYFPQLRAQHFMPRERLQVSYIANLRRGGSRTRMILDYLNGESLDFVSRSICFRTFCSVLGAVGTKKYPHWWISLHEYFGKLEGAREVRQLRKLS